MARVTLAFIFDLDDTLYNQLQAFQYAYYRHFEDSDIGVESLYRHFRQYSDEVFEKTQDGRMSISEMHLYRITNAVRDFDINLPERKARSFQEDYEYAQRNIRLSETMTTLLSKLAKAPIVLGMITNGESDRQRAKIETLGVTQWIPENHIFISGEHGVSKPNRAIFDQVAKQLQLDIEETYYIGDNFENDVLGAANAGWKTIWFNRRNHIVAAQNEQANINIQDEDALATAINHIIASR